MANIRFSELTTASALAESDILAISKVNGESASGYMSFKATMIATAIYITKLATYSSDLDTTDKHIIGAINELKRLISVIPTFSVEVVETLPTEDISEATLYLTPSQNPETENAYDEFIYVNNEWEHVGSTAVDLSAYYTKLETDALLATKANAAEVAASLALKENKSDMQNDVKEIIESCYEEKTVTGNPITIKTISGSNAKGLKVTMNPIQDLHGYSNPWAGGAGKNKLNNTATSQTVNLVDYTVNPDGTVKAEGTATGGYAILTLGSITLENGKEYILSGCPQGGSGSTYSLFISGSGTFTQKVDYGGTIRFTMDETVTTLVSIIVYNGATVDINFEPMIRLASAPSGFEPYSNICPISGRTEASVTRTGKNLANPADMSIFNQNRYFCTTNYSTRPSIQVAPNTQYILSCRKGVPAGGQDFSIYFWNREGEFIYRQKASPFTTPNNCVAISFYCGYADGDFTDADNAKAQVELGSTATTYEPYKTPETHTHQYSETIYGGVDDFVNGGVTSTMGMVDMGSIEWGYDTGYTYSFFKAKLDIPTPSAGYDNGICSQYEVLPARTGSNFRTNDYDGKASFIYGQGNYNFAIQDSRYTSLSDFVTAMSGVQLCYELATPTTISTSAEEITLLKGNNVLSTNADDMELSYQEIPDITPLVQYVQTLEARIKALEEAE